MNATRSKETPIGGCLERLVRHPVYVLTIILVIQPINGMILHDRPLAGLVLIAMQVIWAVKIAIAAEVPNESHHWRRASDVKYETAAQSRRPVHVLC